MGFKPLVALLVIVLLIAAVFVGGADNVSQKLEEYTEKNYKTDPVKFEEYTFLNARYCNMVAKYERALELLDKYDQRFYKEENVEKSLYLRADTLDRKLDARQAKILYEKYMEMFPEGEHIKRVKERQKDLKSYL